MKSAALAQFSSTQLGGKDSECTFASADVKEVSSALSSPESYPRGGCSWGSYENGQSAKQCCTARDTLVGGESSLGPASLTCAWLSHAALEASCDLRESGCQLLAC